MQLTRQGAAGRVARRWLGLVQAHGGTHHGYYLPAEGASDDALALFGFPGLAAYEEYGQLCGRDPESIEADLIRDGSGCVLRYERTFMRPFSPATTVRPDRHPYPCSAGDHRGRTVPARRGRRGQVLPGRGSRGRSLLGGEAAPKRSWTTSIKGIMPSASSRPLTRGRRATLRRRLGRPAGRRRLDPLLERNATCPVPAESMDGWPPQVSWRISCTK
ncbi:NIPSNAP family protein [Actinacidiphila alni]|uniref:NIPSNAP family protein n=1 Tax=Actinacidiphila alni TaxID=380248 RepID=UPI003F4CC929